MIEKSIIEYLNEYLEDIPAMMEYPEEKTIPCVFVEKTGSSEHNRVLSATIAVQSLDTDLQKAAELNEKVKRILKAMEDDVPGIGSVRLNSDYNFTDTNTKNYRYQAIYDITYIEH